MGRPDLVRSLVFAATAALSLVAVVHGLAPRFGAVGALQLHLAGCLVAWAVCFAGSTRRAVRNGFIAGLGAICVLTLARDTAAVALGLTCVLATVRSGLDGRARIARALWVEAALAVVSLAFAAWLAGPGWLGWALGLWGFGLVQSAHALVPRSLVESSAAGTGDPFEQAHAALARLLEEDPVPRS